MWPQAERRRPQSGYVAVLAPDSVPAARALADATQPASTVAQ
jgi:hypothetical protein